MEIDERFMRRALQLASYGRGFVSPNPMVGAVIVRDGMIIGEGWHRRYGEGHAEVNAIAAVEDEDALRDSTMYVTLEPCSHYGKTPPCAKLIIEKGIPRVVVATLDPFEKVAGRGVRMLREAGVDVEVGLLGDESRELNRVFIAAHTRRRPYVVLKWAQSADGYLDRVREAREEAERFSTALSGMAVHQLRGAADAIVVGSGTVLMDDPRLNVRGIMGSDPLKVVLDRTGRVGSESRVFEGGRTFYFGPKRDDIAAEWVAVGRDFDVDELLRELYGRGVTSVMVEGGMELLRSFIESGLWDECRIEISGKRLGEKGSKRMIMPQGLLRREWRLDGNVVVEIENLKEKEAAE